MPIHDERPTEPSNDLTDLPEKPVTDAAAEQVRGGLGNANSLSRAASTSSTAESSASSTTQS